MLSSLLRLLWHGGDCSGSLYAAHISCGQVPVAALALGQRCGKLAPFLVFSVLWAHERMQKIIGQIAAELKVGAAQVTAAVELLDGGATVPFIARYRKEATDGLDDSQLRKLEARLTYLRDLNERRGRIIESIRSQDRLTPDLLSLYLIHI